MHLGRELMPTLGIRCNTTDYTYAVISGSIASPDLIEVKTIKFPANYTQPEKLKWFQDELQNLNRKHGIDGWAIKGTEPMAAKGGTYADRVEIEAMVSLSAAVIGSSNVVRKIKVSIAKDLGLKGRTKSLTDELDYSKVNGLDKMTDKEFEAIVVAWSSL
jgi:hypothetical protein